MAATKRRTQVFKDSNAHDPYVKRYRFDHWQALYALQVDKTTRKLATTQSDSAATLSAVRQVHLAFWAQVAEEVKSLEFGLRIT